MHSWTCFWSMHDQPDTKKIFIDVHKNAWQVSHQSKSFHLKIQRTCFLLGFPNKTSMNSTLSFSYPHYCNKQINSVSSSIFGWSCVPYSSSRKTCYIYLLVKQLIFLHFIQSSRKILFPFHACFSLFLWWHHNAPATLSTCVCEEQQKCIRNELKVVSQHTRIWKFWRQFYIFFVRFVRTLMYFL